MRKMKNHLEDDT